MDEDEILDINTEESEARYASNKSQARANLFDTKRRDRNIQREDAIAADQQNAAAAENEGWGQMIGGWGSAGLAFAIGLTNPFALAAIAATGSFVGAKAGADNVGGYADSNDLRDTYFGQSTLNSNRDTLDDANDDVEGNRIMKSLSTAFSVYNIAGGPIPGTDSWTSKPAMAAADDLTKDEALSQLAAQSLEQKIPLELAQSSAEEVVNKAFQVGSDGMVPDVANIAELGGRNIDDISNLSMIWENISNPNKKGTLMNSGKTKTLWDFMGKGKESLTEWLNRETA
jgi:hypothetical protein